jgi:hypothetical protein
MSMSILQLPVETLHLILCHAQRNDNQARSQDISTNNNTSKSNSVVNISRTCNTLYYAALPALLEASSSYLVRWQHLLFLLKMELSTKRTKWTKRVDIDVGNGLTVSLCSLVQHIDFRRVPATQVARLVNSLACGHGRFVRRLSIKVALGTLAATGTFGISSTSSSGVAASNISHEHQLLLDYNEAMSVSQAVAVLNSLPYLLELDVQFINILPRAYVSQLPQSLDTALSKHTRTLRHLAISADQLKQPVPFAQSEVSETGAEQGAAGTSGPSSSSPSSSGNLATNTSSPADETETNHLLLSSLLAAPSFTLDERMAAGIVLLFPNLSSLTLNRISTDTLARSSPLFESVYVATSLKRLEIAKVQSFDDKWTNQPLMNNLEELAIQDECGLSSDTLRLFIDSNKISLKHLTFKSGSSDANAASFLGCCARCPVVEQITLKNATKFALEQLAGLVRSKTIKSLKCVELVEGNSVARMDEQSLKQLKETSDDVGVHCIC